MFDSGICLTTLRVNLVELMDYDQILVKVTDYMRDHSEGIGAFIKAPYLTNRCRGIDARTPESVLGMVE